MTLSMARWKVARALKSPCCIQAGSNSSLLEVRDTYHNLPGRYSLPNIYWLYPRQKNILIRQGRIKICQYKARGSYLLYWEHSGGDILLLINGILPSFSIGADWRPKYSWRAATAPLWGDAQVWRTPEPHQLWTFGTAGRWRINYPQDWGDDMCLLGAQSRGAL